MVGDLRFGRTVHSLSRLLTRFTNVSVNLVSPAELKMPDVAVLAIGAVGTGSTDNLLKVANASAQELKEAKAAGVVGQISSGWSVYQSNEQAV